MQTMFEKSILNLHSEASTFGKRSFIGVFVNVYAPRANFSEIKKDCFFQILESTVTE